MKRTYRFIFYSILLIPVSIFGIVLHIYTESGVRFRNGVIIPSLIGLIIGIASISSKIVVAKGQMIVRLPIFKADVGGIDHSFMRKIIIDIDKITYIATGPYGVKRIYFDNGKYITLGTFGFTRRKELKRLLDEIQQNIIEKDSNSNKQNLKR